jgi:3-dehydroquinate synthase
MTAQPQPNRSMIERVPVALGARAYDILIGEGVLADAGRYIRPLLRHPRVIVVTDEQVAPLHLSPLQQSFDESGIDHRVIVLPAGEQTKDFAHVETLTTRILDAGIERATPLIALGGGVIGDITGFAAAITLRGLPFMQVPTTLLAQVDSSVGGKTGINTRHGKNLIGAFHQPSLVLADIGVLDTLPRRELLAGYAEVVKYGLIGDAAFFAWLEANGAAVLTGDRPARRHAIKTSCLAKAVIVAEDETEKGVRALLNLGHTFGHALEAETGYGDALLHGEAVAIGMVLAFALSARLRLCPADDAARIRRHFADVGLPTDLGRNVKTASWTVGRLLAHMSKDKKVQSGKMTFILARGIGKAFIAHDVPESDVHAVLEDFLRA